MISVLVSMVISSVYLPLTISAVSSPVATSCGNNAEPLPCLIHALRSLPRYPKSPALPEVTDSTIYVYPVGGHLKLVVALVRFEMVALGAIVELEAVRRTPHFWSSI